MRYISAETGSFRYYGNVKEVVKMFKEAGFTAYDATLCENCGFDDIMQADDWQEKAKAFRAYADSIGMPCNQAHAPFATAKKGNDDYNQKMYPKVVRAIEVSGILGAKVCVVHPCNDYTAEENAVLYKSFEDVARKAGVKIGVENMWNWKQGSPTATPAACSHHDDFKKHLDLLSSDVFVACVDIGHAEMAGLDTSAAQMIETLGDYVQSMHLHDVDGIRDNHQIPFTQAIDFQKVIQALRNINYQGDITLETAYSGVKAPKELNAPLARYLAAVANYFKEEVEKE